MKKFFVMFFLLVSLLLTSCGDFRNENGLDSSDLNNKSAISITIDAGSASKGISVTTSEVIKVTIELTDPTGNKIAADWYPGNNPVLTFYDRKFGMNTITLKELDDSGYLKTDSKQIQVLKGYNYRVNVTLGGNIIITPDDGSQFTIAVIPDTQNYCDVTQPQPASIQVFQREMQYLADQKDAQDIVFATHVGDVVQRGDLDEGAWNNAASAISILSASGIPFGMSPGNHDYDNYSHSANSRPLSGSVKWNQYFGPNSSYFSGKTWYGTSTFNGALSSYQTFTAAGKTFLHISLEQEASDDALVWAASIISNHTSMPTIVTTHEYLNYKNETDGKPRYLDDGYMNGAPHNNAQAVWDKLISKNDQIFMVICGHNWSSTVNGVSDGESLRIDNNDAGHPVYQVLTDYQGNTFDITGAPSKVAGGAGWLRLMKFDVSSMTIHFQTYSTELHVYAGMSGGPTFNLDPSESDFTLPIPDRVLTH
jgi:hypothetical protein